jgi:RND family efflux transporter MFP subunit
MWVNRTQERNLQRPGLCGSLVLFGVAILGGCDTSEPPPRQEVRVQVITARPADIGPAVSVTGEIKARFQNDLSFRVTGKIIERNVDVGAHVLPGDVLARLEPNEQEANLKSATAAVESAEAQLRQASSAFERQKSLMTSGFTTRRDFDQAQEAYRTAQASLDTAKAQQTQAEDQLGYTVLKADAPGLITARFAETGQVVQGAQPVFTIARDGPRDAVFDVDERLLTHAPESMTVHVALASNPAIAAEGPVREIAPTVNTSNGTIRVKIELKNLPPEMTLGAPVIASGRIKAAEGFAVPWNALSKAAAKPAVWIADPKTKTVSLRPVTVARYETGRVLLKDGIKAGELVVTAGSQLLWPGRIVEPVEEAAR